MRTIEEVREHLEKTGYKSEDMNKIFSFLQKRYPMEELAIQSNDLNYGSFLEWYFEEEKEEKLFEIIYLDSAIKDVKNSKYTTRKECEDIESRIKAKKELDKALKDLDETEQYFEMEIEKMTNPDMKNLAKGFLEFAKGLKEEIKKDTSV